MKQSKIYADNFERNTFDLRDQPDMQLEMRDSKGATTYRGDLGR